jgi:hypothetical protein
LYAADIGVFGSETSAFLITFILLGKYLEASAKGRTSEAITKLFNRIPPVAILLHTAPDGQVIKEETVQTSLIHRGDLLKVLLLTSNGNCCPKLLELDSHSLSPLPPTLLCVVDPCLPG